MLVKYAQQHHDYMYKTLSGTSSSRPSRNTLRRTPTLAVNSMLTLTTRLKSTKQHKKRSYHTLTPPKPMAQSLSMEAHSLESPKRATSSNQPSSQPTRMTSRSYKKRSSDLSLSFSRSRQRRRLLRRQTIRSMVSAPQCSPKTSCVDTGWQILSRLVWFG